jgi:hypothetical protein
MKTCSVLALSRFSLLDDMDVVAAVALVVVAGASV